MVIQQIVTLTKVNAQGRTSLSIFTSTHATRTMLSAAETIIRTTLFSTATDNIGYTNLLPYTLTYTGIVLTPMPTVDTIPPSVEILPDNSLRWKNANSAVFMAGYLPVIMATLLQLIWAAIYANVKIIYPFIRLAQKDGALARDTLFAFYFSSNCSAKSWLSLVKDHGLMTITSTTYLLVLCINPLASELLFLDMDYDCPVPDLSRPDQLCWPPLIFSNPTVLRVLQALLSIIALLTLWVLVELWNINTGIQENPTKLSTVAALFRHQDVLLDFRESDPNASTKSLRKSIGRMKYRLSYYNGTDDSPGYGVVPMRTDDAPLAEKEDSCSASDKTDTKKWDFFLDVAFLLLLLSILGVVIAYYFDISNSAFNSFFNSDSFGPRFVMTVLGSVVASNWSRLERCKFGLFRMLGSHFCVMYVVLLTESRHSYPHCL